MVVFERADHPKETLARLLTGPDPMMAREHESYYVDQATLDGQWRSATTAPWGSLIQDHGEATPDDVRDALAKGSRRELPARSGRRHGVSPRPAVFVGGCTSLPCRRRTCGRGQPAGGGARPPRAHVARCFCFPHRARPPTGWRRRRSAPSSTASPRTRPATTSSGGGAVLCSSGDPSCVVSCRGARVLC